MITDPSLLMPYFLVRTNKITIGSGATRILTAEPRRVSIIFVNNGQNPAWIQINGSVSSTNGILLNPTGGTSSGGVPNAATEIFFARHGALCQSEWYAGQLAISGTIMTIETLWMPPNGRTQSEDLQDK